MWSDILKQPKTILGNKSKMKRNLKPIPEKPPKKTCMETLQEYGDKLREVEGILGELKEKPGAPNERKFVKKGKFDWKAIQTEEEPVPSREGHSQDHNSDEEEELQIERAYSIVKEVPEEVACKALEYLKRDVDDVQHRTFKDKNDKSWIIIWRVDTEFEEYPAVVFGQDFADASVFLYIRESLGDVNRAEGPYHVKLNRSINLYKDYDEAEEQRWATELDWR